jgi:hypothetical protein
MVPLGQNLPAISGKAFKKLQRIGVPETFSLAFMQQHGLAQITIETDRGTLTIIALAEEHQITTIYHEGQLYKTSIYPDGKEPLPPPPVVPPPQVQPREEVLAEHQRFLDLLEQCPPAIRDRYRSEADEALRNPHEAPRITQLRGVIFRLIRTLDVARQGLETTDYSRAQTDLVKHLGYARRETDFSHPPTEDCESEIKIDIPLVREGGIYAYLVKVSPRTPFGRDAGARNQMLRLQAAISQKIITGATVEIKGRIDHSFLAWAAGTSPIDPGAVPDVEIIYTFELPSGAEYRFPLKRSRGNHSVKFQSAETWYTPEDREIIQGLHLALQDINKPIIDIITGATVADPSEPLREILETKGPTGILTLELFHEYETKRLQTIWQMLLAQSPAVNTENERNVRHIFETCQNPAEVRRYVEAGVKEFMQFLQNEAIARKKGLRPIEEPTKLTALIDEICDRIDFIQQRQQAQPVSPTEDGFVGRPEGIALPFNFIVIDAMRYLQAMERGSQKVVYSYRHPERFKELPAALAAVAREDRYYREVTVSEPYGLVETRDFAHFDKPKAKLDILRRSGFIDKEGVIQPSFPSDFETFFATVMATARGEVKTEERNVWVEAFQILQRGCARKTYVLANPAAEVVERVRGEMVHETIRRADVIVQ